MNPSDTACYKERPAGLRARLIRLRIDRERPALRLYRESGRSIMLRNEMIIFKRPLDRPIGARRNSIRNSR